jgi:hypothetical protein
MKVVNIDRYKTSNECKTERACKKEAREWDRRICQKVDSRKEKCTNDNIYSVWAVVKRGGL